MLLFFFPNHSKASHAAAAEIAYRCIGSNQVVVTVNLFSDCSVGSLQLNASLDIHYTSASGGQNLFQAIPLLPGGVEVSTSTYPPCTPSTCNGGSGYGIKKYVYQGTITLPGAYSDWLLYAELFNRNGLTTSINNALSYSIYLEAGFDNLNFPLACSPVFARAPVVMTCINDSFNYDGLGSDADNDSLVYQLIPARGSIGAGNPVISLPYNTPYSATSPLMSVSGSNLNSQTGIFQCVPSQLQGCVIAEQINQFQGGILTGYVTRDMQILVDAFCNVQPDFRQTLIDSLHCGDSAIVMHLNTPVQCATVSANGSEFLVTGPAGDTITIYSLAPMNAVSGFCSRLKLSFGQRLNTNGTYHIVNKTGTDLNTFLNRCGYSMPFPDTIPFSVSDCYTGTTDLLNVSVNESGDAGEVTWSVPVNLSPSDFLRYVIFRSDSSGATCVPVGVSSAMNDTIFTDLSAEVNLRSYQYTVQTEMNTGLSTPFSDSIHSIFLTATPLPDSMTVRLDWTDFNGWNGAEYEVMVLNGDGTSAIVDGSQTTQQTYLYSKPKRNGSYRLRIRSINTSGPSLMTMSNIIKVEVLHSEVTVPNVMTANNDKLNDTFNILNLDQYPGSELSVFNRSGKKIYESKDYRNDWDGDDQQAGTYFYVLKVADKQNTSIHGILTLIR